MKNRLKIVMTMTIAILASQIFGQVRIVNSATNAAANSSSAFIDASSNSTTNPTNNIGKGLLFPRTDLTTFSAFSGTPLGLPTAYPTRYDGMIVYNTGTGSTLASASDSIVSVTPGFYYYDNKTTNLKGGKWTRIDATSADISKLLVQSPAKDSIINVISSNGKTLSNGNGILINGSNSLAKSVLADASLRIDSTAIAKMIMQSPVKDSVATSVTNLINQNKVAGKALTNGNGIIVTGGDSSVLKATSLRIDSTAIAKMVGQSPVKDSITKLVTSSPVKDSIVKTLSTTQSFKDSITNIISANGKTLSNGNGILINGSNSLAKSVLADASLRIDSTAIAKMIMQSPVKDSVATSVTNLINQNKVAGKALTNGNGIIVTGGDSSVLKATSLRIDSTAIAKMVGQSPVKDSITKLVTSSPVKDSIVKTLSTTQSFKDSITNIISANGKTLSNGNGILINGSNSLAKSVLADASLRIDSTAIAKMIMQSPVKDSVATSVTNLINQNKVAGKALTNGNGIIVTGGDSSVLKATSLRIDSTAIAKMVGQSPVKDSITKLVTSSPVKDSIVKTLSTTQSFKDSITNIISANGKTLSNGNGILINGSNSLAKSVLADASLRIDSTAIAKMIGQSPVKDSVSSTVTTLITSGSITGKTTTAGSLVMVTNGSGAALKDNTIAVDTTAMKSFISNSITNGGVVGVNTTAGSLITVTNGTGATLKNMTVAADTTALKTFIANNVNKSPIGDSIATSVTNLINQNKVAGKALTNGNGIIVTGGDSSVLKATSLRIDSTAIAKFMTQSPVKDSAIKAVTTSQVFKDSVLAVSSSLSINAANGLTKNASTIELGGALTKPTTITTTIANTLSLTGLQSAASSDSVLMITSAGVVKQISSSSIKPTGANLTNGNGVIITGGTGATLTATSLRIDSSAIATMIGQSPVKDSITKLVTSSPTKDSLIKTISNTQSFKDSITNIISANGKTLSNGRGILINGSNSLAKSVLADASLRIDSSEIAKMIGQSPVKDSVANVVTNLINQNKVAGKALTNGNGIIVTGGDSSVLKATSLRIDSTAIAKFVGQSPMKDSLTALINTTAPKTPDSTTASNGLTMTGKDIRLGGSLTAATTVTTSATNTLTIAGLQSGTTSDSIVMISGTGVLKRMATSVMSDKTQTNNGLSKSGDTVQLGGTLTKATTITTSATNTLALPGLQSGSVSDSVITWDASTSILKKRTASSLASTLPFKTVSSPYAVGVNDYTINCNFSGPGFLTLPSASANTGRMLRILVQNGDVTFLPALKDGATTVATMHSGTMVSNGITQDNKITIQSDGTDWWIVGQ